MSKRTTEYYMENYRSPEKVVSCLQLITEVAAESGSIERGLLKRLRSWVSKCYLKEHSQAKYFSTIEVDEKWLSDPAMFISWCEENGLFDNPNLRIRRHDTRGNFDSENLYVS